MLPYYKYIRNAFQASLDFITSIVTTHFDSSKTPKRAKNNPSSQMGKENSDPIVIQSSIALLQERFRQLQRVKAMREEKELSRNIHVESAKQISPTMQYHEPAAANNQLFFHPELILQPEFILQPRSPPHVCLSLWPNPQSKQAGFWCEETPALMSLSSTKTPSRLGVLDEVDASATDDDDIDTSLHL